MWDRDCEKFWWRGDWVDPEFVRQLFVIRMSLPIERLHRYDKPIAPDSRNIDPFLRRRMWK